MTRVRRWLPLLLLATLAACGGERSAARTEAAAAPPDTILAFAASDLQAAFAELVPRYEAGRGVRVQLSFGSTGNLTTQIESGAPADLLFAASESYLDRLAGKGMIDPGTRRVYARGRLALVWDSAAPAPARLEDLARPEYRVIAIANPEHAPYGMAARQALQAAGVWERVKGRLVLGENVNQTYQFVRSGNAQAGIVALGLVTGGAPRAHLLLPDSLHAPLKQAAAVVKTSRHGAAARAFLEFVTGAEGQAILRRYGFEGP